MVSLVYFICKLCNLNDFLLFVVNFQKLLALLIKYSYCFIIIMVEEKLNWIIAEFKLRVADTIHKWN